LTIVVKMPSVINKKQRSPHLIILMISHIAQSLFERFIVSNEEKKKSTSGKSSQFNETFEINRMLCVGWGLEMFGKNLVHRNH
jgi:hypothetical protein